MEAIQHGCYERRCLSHTLRKAVNYHLCYKWSHIPPACRRPLIQTNHRSPAQSPALSTLSFALTLPHTHMNINSGKGAVMRGFILLVSLIHTHRHTHISASVISITLITSSNCLSSLQAESLTTLLLRHNYQITHKYISTYN